MRRIVPILALAVLVPTGCGRGTTSHVDVPPAPSDTTNNLNLVLAEVSGLQITGGDLKNYMTDRSGEEGVERHMQNPDILQIGLGSFVDQFAWAEQARRHGIQLSHEDMMKVRSLEAELLATRYMAEVVQWKAVPSRETVEKYYQEHQERFLAPARVGVRHIQVDTQAEAEQLLGRLRDGADFAELAKRHSKDKTSRDLGGALGFVESGKPILGLGKDEAFSQAVLPMEVGDLAVVKSAVAWHVVKAEKREGGGLIPLDQVYETISKGLTSQDFSRVYNDDLAVAREQVKARYLTENFNKFSGVADNPGRLFQAAAQSTDPLAKIELYRRIAFDFPDYKQAAEAQFMMGYVSLTEFGNKADAESAVKRLRDVFPRSPWRRAGEWMLEHFDAENPKSLGTPRDIVGKASGKQ